MGFIYLYYYIHTIRFKTANYEKFKRGLPTPFSVEAISKLWIYVFIFGMFFIFIVNTCLK